MQLNTYLTFNGNCKDAFKFYRGVFGGEFSAFQTFGDGPPDMEIPESIRDHVMHVSLPIGESTLMGSDNGPGRPDASFGSNFSVSVAPDSREACDTLFARMAEGGSVEMPLSEMFWGAYFGICRDKFGISWMFNLDAGQRQG